MNPGRRDTKITIEAPNRTTSGLGEREPTWGTIATEWAEKRNLKGQEYEQAQQIAGETETKFTVDYNSNSSAVTNKHRVKDGSVYYDILQVIEIPGGRPELIELYTKKRTTDG